MSVTVRVPATIANLGPGFDCLGLAVAWHNRITLVPASTTTVDVTGPGEERIPRDEANLVLRGIRAFEDASGNPRMDWKIRIENSSPYGRGFGSSAAAIVGGIVAAQASMPDDRGADPLALGGALEGHLDNVAPALMGGITLCGFSANDAMRIEPPPGLVVVACVAAERLSTAKARAALPKEIAVSDAIFNISRTALLAAALGAGDFDRLLQATEDRLHQPARFEIAPDSGALAQTLRAGGYAAFLSGAGPSVAALVPVDRAHDCARRASEIAPPGWTVRILEIDTFGAVLEG
jgi:homoserine kinase